MLSTKQVAYQLDVSFSTVLKWARVGVRLTDGTRVFLPVAKRTTSGRCKTERLWFTAEDVGEFAKIIDLDANGLNIVRTAKKSGICSTILHRWINQGVTVQGVTHKLRTVGRASRRQILLSDLRDYLRLVARAKAEQYEAMAERLEGVA